MEKKVLYLDVKRPVYFGAKKQNLIKSCTIDGQILDFTSALDDLLVNLKNDKSLAVKWVPPGKRKAVVLLKKEVTSDGASVLYVNKNEWKKVSQEFKSFSSWINDHKIPFAHWYAERFSLSSLSIISYVSQQIDEGKAMPLEPLKRQKNKIDREPVV